VIDRRYRHEATCPRRQDITAVECSCSTLRLVVTAKAEELGYQPGEMIDDQMAIAEAVVASLAPPRTQHGRQGGHE
jgi:hypothetical protein